jgi:ribonuclease HI
MSNVIKDKNKNKNIKLNKGQKKEYYYAVKKGHSTGIFPNWDACKKQVIGFPGALYKKFDNITDAKKYLVSSFMRSNKKKSSKSKSNDLDSLDDKNKLNVQKVMSAKKIASLLKKGTIMLQTNTHENLKKKIEHLELKQYNIKSVSNKYHPDFWTLYRKKHYLFTDGSFKTNTKKSGYAVYLGKNATNIQEDMKGATNNYCELKSILVCLELIKKYINFIKNPIIIVSDSEYCIKSITEWMPKWKKNDWLTASKKPVANLDLFKKIDKLMMFLNEKSLNNDLQLSFLHQNSHLSRPKDCKENSIKYQLWEGNYIVDFLAQNIDI